MDCHPPRDVRRVPLPFACADEFRCRTKNAALCITRRVQEIGSRGVRVMDGKMRGALVGRFRKKRMLCVPCHGLPGQPCTPPVLGCCSRRTYRIFVTPRARRAPSSDRATSSSCVDGRTDWSPEEERTRTRQRTAVSGCLRLQTRLSGGRRAASRGVSHRAQAPPIHRVDPRARGEAVAPIDARAWAQSAQKPAALPAQAPTVHFDKPRPCKYAIRYTQV